MCYNIFMNLAIAVLFFIISCIGLAAAGNILVRSIARIADYLGWKEFTVSFIVMSFATAMPELFVGISSALRGVPELSFGNIIGQSIIHFTVAVSVCVIVGGSFRARSSLIRTTAWFSGFMALLPVILILDKNLSRVDGFILILSFILYVLWSFSKKRRFTKKYDKVTEYPNGKLIKIKMALRDVGLFLVGVLIIILSAQGIIESTKSIAMILSVPLVMIGVLIVGLGTSLPEMYFSALSAKKENDDLMLGNLLGSTAVSVSMVLGVVAMISPISVPDLSPYLISRIFLITSVVAFIFFMTTGKKVTVKEGLWLLVIYILFVITEVLAGIFI